MGTRKNDLTWTWPLISLEWIPEILCSFDALLEPSWPALKRQMTVNAQNESFANRIFEQLQSFLLQTALVKEERRYIHPVVNGDYSDTQKHLSNIFKESDNNKWYINTN